MNVKQRKELERKIVEQLLTELIEQGFEVRFDDMSGDLPPIVNNVPDAMKQAFSVDEEYLFIYDKLHTYIGHVFLAYGNDGWDAITDYSIDVEKNIQKTLNWIDELYS